MRTTGGECPQIVINAPSNGLDLKTGMVIAKATVRGGLATFRGWVHAYWSESDPGFAPDFGNDAAASAGDQAAAVLASRTRRFHPAGTGKEPAALRRIGG